MNPLDKYLKEKKITQKQIAKKIGATEGAIANYIKGRRCPTLEKAYRIQQATGDEVTMKQLLLWYVESNQ